MNTDFGVPVINILWTIVALDCGRQKISIRRSSGSENDESSEQVSFDNFNQALPIIFYLLTNQQYQSV